MTPSAIRSPGNWQTAASTSPIWLLLTRPAQPLPSSVWKRTAAAPSASTANPRQTCSILRSRSTRHGLPMPLPCTSAVSRWRTAPCATPTLRPFLPPGRPAASSALTRTCAFPSGRTATCCAERCCSSCRFPTSSKFQMKSWNFSPARRTSKPPCRSCSWVMCSWWSTPAAAVVPTPTPAPPMALPPAGKSGLWTPPVRAMASSAPFCGSWNVTA